jgi:hypothetical protein
MGRYALLPTNTRVDINDIRGLHILVNASIAHTAFSKTLFFIVKQTNHIVGQAANPPALRL